MASHSISRRSPQPGQLTLASLQSRCARVGQSNRPLSASECRPWAAADGIERADASHLKWLACSACEQYFPIDELRWLVAATPSRVEVGRWSQGRMNESDPRQAGALTSLAVADPRPREDEHDDRHDALRSDVGHAPTSSVAQELRP